MCIYESAGVLQKGDAKILSVLTAFAKVEILADALQASDADHRWKRPRLFVQAAVYDQRVEFIGKLSWLSITVAMRDFPFQMEVSTSASFDDPDIDLALL